MTELAKSIAVLDDALKRCREEDMRTAEVLAVLDYVQTQSHIITWPCDQLRSALNRPEPDARWHNLNTSLNAIKAAVSGRITKLMGYAFPAGASASSRV
jgi:hypothetical protein